MACCLSTVNCSECSRPVSTWWEIEGKKLCQECLLHREYHRVEEKHKEYHKTRPPMEVYDRLFDVRDYGVIDYSKRHKKKEKPE